MAWRAFFLAWLLLLPLAEAAPAKDMFITDRLQVTLRTGPSVENKIIGVLASGDLVTTLANEENGWIRVRSAEGKEGWMIVRYLQEEKPAVVRIKEMDPSAAASGAPGRGGELEKENAELKAQVAALQLRVQQAQGGMQRLKEEGEEGDQLKAEFDRLQKEFSEQAKRLDEVSAEAESLRFGTNLKWFLAGGGVLLVGWLLGAALGRRKGRFSSSLY